MKRQANDDLREDLEKIRAALAEVSAEVKSRAGEILIYSLTNKLHEMQDNVAEYAAEKPFKSLGIAAGLGFAIGFLWRK